MVNAAKKTLERKSLKWKVTIAFIAMSVIPTMAMLYLLTAYVPFSRANLKQIAFVFFLCLWLGIAGYVMVRQIVDAVASIARKTKTIAEGHYDIKVLQHADTELKDIAEAVNSMTDRMRNYISELRKYGDKTGELNEKIIRKVATLTNLVRVGEMISSGEDFDETGMFAARSISEEMDGGAVAIFLRTETGRYRMAAFNKGKESLLSGDILLEKLPYVENLLKNHAYVVVDSHLLREPWQKEIRRRLGDINATFFSINSSEGIVGVVAVMKTGKDVIFDHEMLEVIGAFNNEIVLSYRSMEAAEKIRNLEVVDKSTGVYSFNYMKERLDDEVSRAVYYGRPCSLIVVDVDGPDKKLSNLQENEREQVLKEIAGRISKICPLTGKTGKFGFMEFAMILPEVNKRESMEIGEKIRKEIEAGAFYSWEKGFLTASVGVGENPIDGASAEKILSRALDFMTKAREEGGNRVVGE